MFFASLIKATRMILSWHECEIKKACDGTLILKHSEPFDSLGFGEKYILWVSLIEVFNEHKKVVRSCDLKTGLVSFIR